MTTIAGMNIGRAVTAGLVAGLVFLIAEMVLVPTMGGGALWGPPRMMSAIALGEGVLPPPATFNAAVVAVGMLVHFALSAVLGVIFALIAARLSLGRGALIALGAVFGLVVYVVNFHGLTAIFPWFAMARNWITILAHLIFGVVLAWWLARDARTPAAA